MEQENNPHYGLNHTNIDLPHDPPYLVVVKHDDRCCCGADAEDRRACVKRILDVLPRMATSSLMPVRRIQVLHKIQKLVMCHMALKHWAVESAKHRVFHLVARDSDCHELEPATQPHPVCDPPLSVCHCWVIGWVSTEDIKETPSKFAEHRIKVCQELGNRVGCAGTGGREARAEGRGGGAGGVYTFVSARCFAVE